MDIKRRLLLLATVAAATAAAGGSWWFAGLVRDRRRAARQNLLIAGASTMLSLNRALAKGYSELHAQIDIIVDQGGSLPGLIALKRGAIDIAAMSRDLVGAEDSAPTRSFLIAKNEIGIAVHPQSPVRELGFAQIQAIFTGRITHWDRVGGPRQPIRVISRKAGSTSRKFVEEVVLKGEDIRRDAPEMDSAAEVADRIQQDKQAIGYIALKDRDTTPLHYLSVDGVVPERATVLSGRYPLTQPLYLVIQGEGNTPASRFVDFARGPAGQQIVAAQNLIPVA